MDRLSRADADIDLLIERRAYEAEQANREAQAWAESAQHYNLRRAAAEAARERAVERLARLVDEAAG